MPKDWALIRSNSPEKLTAQFVNGYGAREIPSDHDFIVTAKYVNEKIIDWFHGEVNGLSLIEDGDGPSTHMQTSWTGGHIEVVRSWVSGKSGSLYNKDEVAPLVIARSFLHEVRHAAGEKEHDGCSNYFGHESECDDSLIAAYGVGAQLGQALVLGAMYSRVGLDEKATTIVPSYVIGQLFTENCNHLVAKVNNVGRWVSESDQYGTCAGSFVNDAMELRVFPPSVGTLHQPETFLPWTCEASSNSLIHEL